MHYFKRPLCTIQLSASGSVNVNNSFLRMENQVTVYCTNRRCSSSQNAYSWSLPIPSDILHCIFPGRGQQMGWCLQRIVCILTGGRQYMGRCPFSYDGMTFCSWTIPGPHRLLWLARCKLPRILYEWGITHFCDLGPPNGCGCPILRTFHGRVLLVTPRW